MRVAVVLIILAAIAQAQETGTLHGRVLDPDGKPLEGKTVTAHCVSTERPLSRAVKTNAAGVFRIDGLPVGEYVLEIGTPKRGKKLDDLAAAIARSLEELAQSVLRQNARGHPHLVAVEPGKALRHDIRLPRYVPVTVALRHGDKPVPRAVVKLVRLNKKGDASWTLTVGQSRPPRTDAKGEVTFRSVPEGRYAVVVEIADWEVHCGTLQVAGKQPVRSPITLGLFAVRVRVLDARGNPVTTAEPGLAGGKDWVGVSPRDFGEIRSPTGVYTIPYVQEGRYEPYVNVGSAHASAAPVQVGPKSPHPEVVLRLPATGSLVVRVVDGNGKPVQGIHVRVQHSTGMPGYGYDTDAKGEIRIDDMTEGIWLVGLEGGALRFKGSPRKVQLRGFKEARVELKVAD